jgi:hypothetical protein
VVREKGRGGVYSLYLLLSRCLTILLLGDALRLANPESCQTISQSMLQAPRTTKQSMRRTPRATPIKTPSEPHRMPSMRKPQNHSTYRTSKAPKPHRVVSIAARRCYNVHPPVPSQGQFEPLIHTLNTHQPTCQWSSDRATK